jgi:hypothetical protein
MPVCILQPTAPRATHVKFRLQSFDLMAAHTPTYRGVKLCAAFNSPAKFLGLLPRAMRRLSEGKSAQRQGGHMQSPRRASYKLCHLFTRAHRAREREDDSR